MRRAFCFLLIAALLAGCARIDRLDFGSLGRDMWQRPKDVIAALAIRPGSTVADVGAGKGYFVPHLAGAVGANGRVLAVEVDDGLIAHLRTQYGRQPNIELIRGAFEDPKLPDGTVDLVLLVNVYHHLENRPAYFRRVLEDLSPGGRVAVIDFDAELGGLLGLFISADHASRTTHVVSEMRLAGYRLVARHDILPVQLMLVFAPEAS